MKKIIAFTLILTMLFALTACGKAPAQQTSPPAENSAQPVETPEEGAAQSAFKLGMGIVVSTDASVSGTAQVDATAAALVLDAQGKIVSCRLDCAQSKLDLSQDEFDMEQSYKTKMELGEDYGMKAYGNAVAEWDEQARAFEQYLVGKTAQEVEAIATQTDEEGHSVPADETLRASCTMDVSDFISAVVKACGDVNSMSFDTAESFSLGLAAITHSDESQQAQEDEEGTARLYSDFGAVVLDAEGRIIAALTDSIQPQISFDTAGEITQSQYEGSKMELGDDYGMLAYGNAIAEWDEQAAAFVQYCVGKTAQQLRQMETQEQDGHELAADESLYASCTIDISGMKAVVAQAADYAR